MKRFRNLVIGGIQSKIFTLILFTVILLTGVNVVVSLYHSNMLSQLAEESAAKQQASIDEITSSIMDQVVTQTLERSSRKEAMIANELFIDARRRVAFVTDSAAKLFAHPGDYSPASCDSSAPAQDGVWTMQAIYADGVDPADPAVASKVDLLANLAEMLKSFCPSFDVANLYIALPEGVHLYVSDTSESWFENGSQRSYDPRQRGWYGQAAREGRLIFTEGEYDAATGAYCIECAAPVYGPDGSLQAVVGSDVFLTEIQENMLESTLEGEHQLLINQNGRAVLAPQEEDFPLAEEDRGGDLRLSKNGILSRVVDEALHGKSAGVLEGELADGRYYITAEPIETTGWVLINAFNHELARKPVKLLQENNQSIQAQATESYREKQDLSNKTALVLLLAVTLLMLVGSVLLGKRIVKPLNTITKRISGLSEGNLEFKMEDAYRTGDEVEELARSFATLSHKTMEYVDTVKRVTAEKERIGAELSLATRIQAAMLPHLVPAFPNRRDFDILGSMDPAKEVGGDFYDYFLIDEDHLCMVIADVSGKGVPAALFMMASKIILQSVAMLGASPAGILAKTNEAICSNNEAQMFVTVWLGILTLSTGKLVAANAGHEYPVLKRADGGFEVLKDRHGFVIGGMEGTRYHEYELNLEPGSKLFVYTDGVPEATDANKELFGMERMVNALNAAPDDPPQMILKNVRKAVDQFVGGAEQFDDLTMMCLEYKGPVPDDAEKGGGL